MRPPGVVFAEEHVELFPRVVVESRAHGPDEAEQKGELDDRHVRLGFILEIGVQTRIDAVLRVVVRVEQSAELSDGGESIGVHQLLQLQPPVLEAFLHVLLQHSRQRLDQDFVLGVLWLLKP